METNYKEIKYLGENVKLLQYLSESNTQFINRIEYIRKLEKNNISSTVHMSCAFFIGEAELMVAY